MSAMGLFKGILLFGFGVPVRLTTKKQRMYRRQMGYPETAHEAVGNLLSRAAGGSSADLVGHEFTDSVETGFGRVPCPTCAEMILPAAVMCRFCSKPTGFSKAPKAVSAPTPTSFLSTPYKERPLSKLKFLETDMTRCPSCDRYIVAKATICRYCKASI